MGELEMLHQFNQSPTLIYIIYLESISPYLTKAVTSSAPCNQGGRIEKLHTI